MTTLELPSPHDLTPAARAAEIAAILAAAIVRSFAATEPNQSAVGLGFLPNQRVHATPYQDERL